MTRGEGEDVGHVDDFSTVVLQRLSYGPNAMGEISHMIRGFQARGARVLYELDDDLWRNQMTRAAGPLYLPRPLRKAVENGMSKLIGMCNAVIVSTEDLGREVARRANRKVHVIPNAVTASLCEVPGRPHDGVRIGWVGSLSHQLEGDFAPLLPALRRLLAERPDVTLVFMGHRPPGTEGWPRVEHHAWVPVETYYAKLAQLGLDCFVAPLADTRFNAAKSASKLYEAAALGLPIIASPHGPYRDQEAIVSGYATSADEWHALLARLVHNPGARRADGAAARATVRQHHTMDQTGPLWERLLIGVHTEPLTVG